MESSKMSDKPSYKLLHRVPFPHRVWGVTVLDHRVYVICFKQPNVHIFDIHRPLDGRYQFVISIEEIHYPSDISACAPYQCLYISEREYNEKRYRKKQDHSTQIRSTTVTDFESEIQDEEKNSGKKNSWTQVGLRTDNAYEANAQECEKLDSAVKIWRVRLNKTGTANEGKPEICLLLEDDASGMFSLSADGKRLLMATGRASGTPAIKIYDCEPKEVSAKSQQLYLIETLLLTKNIKYPNHAIEIENSLGRGTYMVSHGAPDGDSNGLYEASKDDSKVSSPSNNSYPTKEIQTSAKKLRMRYPLHLAMDKMGRTLVVDHGNARLFLFDQKLQNEQDLYEWKWDPNNVARGPGRLCLVALPCTECTRLLVGLGQGSDNPKDVGAVDIFDYKPVGSEAEGFLQPRPTTENPQYKLTIVNANNAQFGNNNRMKMESARQDDDRNPGQSREESPEVVPIGELVAGLAKAATMPSIRQDDVPAGRTATHTCISSHHSAPAGLHVLPTSHPCHDPERTAYSSVIDWDNDPSVKFVERRKKFNNRQRNPGSTSGTTNYATALSTSRPEPVAPRLAQHPTASRPTQARHPVMLGSVQSPSLKAAANLQIEKYVFKISNIDAVNSVSNLIEHLTTIGVRVAEDSRGNGKSCFELKPGPRQPPKNKCFRVCIFAADKSKLFIKENWDSGILIEDWVFHPKASSHQPPLRSQNRPTTACPSTENQDVWENMEQQSTNPVQSKL